VDAGVVSGGVDGAEAGGVSSTKEEAREERGEGPADEGGVSSTK
jgi:hypothetical protein